MTRHAMAAPKSPPMHWGWAAGYRFRSFEGMTGASMTHRMAKIHASLENRNYNLLKLFPTAGFTNGVPNHPPLHPA